MREGRKRAKGGEEMEEEREKGEMEIQRMVDKKGCGRKRKERRE